MLQTLLFALTGYHYFLAWLEGYTRQFSPSLAVLILLLYISGFLKLRRRGLLLFFLFLMIVLLTSSFHTSNYIPCEKEIYGKVVERGENSAIIKNGDIFYLLKGASPLEGKIFVTGTVVSKKGIWKGYFYECVISVRELYSLSDNDNPVNWWKVRNEAYMSISSAAFVNGVIYGDRRGLPRKVKTLFEYLGLSHILAISGLHIGFVGGILYLLFRIILREIPQLLERGIVIPLSLTLSLAGTTGYYFLSGVQISAARALLIFAFYVVSVWIRRKVNPIHLFQLVALMILIFDPGELFSLSFLLSFLAYGTILAMMGLGNRFIKMKYIFPLMISGSMIPVTSYLSGYLPLFSPFANLLFVPLFGVILFPSLVAGQIIALRYPGFLKVNDFMIRKTFSLLELFKSRLPDYFLQVPLNGLIAMLSLISIALFRLRGRFAVVVLLFGIVQFAGAIYMLERNPTPILVEDEYQLDLNLRMHVSGEKWRNYILRKWRYYPSMFSVDKGRIILKQGIRCLSFYSAGNSYAEGSCELGDVFIGLFETMAEYLCNVYHYGVGKFAVLRGNFFKISSFYCQ